MELLRRASQQHAGSGGGDLTAVALYTRLEVAEGALSKEKEESGRAKALLSQILADIDAKAPLLAKMRKDYESALAAYEQARAARIESERALFERLRVAGIADLGGSDE